MDCGKVAESADGEEVPPSTGFPVLHREGPPAGLKSLSIRSVPVSAGGIPHLFPSGLHHLGSPPVAPLPDRRSVAALS